MLFDLVGEDLHSGQPRVAPDFGAPSDVDVDEVLQMLVKSIDLAAPWSDDGLVVDMAVTDEDVVVVTRD